jgi:hypothetical protein
MRKRLCIQITVVATVALLIASCGERVPITGPDVPMLDVFPDSIGVEVSSGRDFEAGFEGRPHVVRWYVDGVPAGDPWKGIITTTGDYTAPASVPAGGFVTVRAKSLEDPSLEGTATVRILPGASGTFVAVQPETATVKAEGRCVFTCMVSGCNSGDVIWSLEIVTGLATGGLGDIRDNGVYEAPITSGDNFEVLIRATSVGCPDKSGIAKVKVPAQPRPFTVELEHFENSFNVPGSVQIKRDQCSMASSGESVVGLDRIGEYIEVPIYVRGAGEYLPYVRYASAQGTRMWVRVEVDGCGAAGTTAGFTLDQGEGMT